MNRPLILITNDDGIHAAGIRALYEAMGRIGDPVIVAPDSEKSATSHAITLSDPLRPVKVSKGGEFYGWAVNGTPADCVKLAIKGLLAREPDLVVSGINHGSNTAINVFYSGTVAGAMEGTIMGVPSVAFSITTWTPPDYIYATEIAQRIAASVLQNGLPDDTLLNVNIPPLPKEKIRGVKITRQGKGRFAEAFEKRIDPVGRPYFWLAGSKLMLDTDEDIDDVAINNHYVSVTPLRLNLTNAGMITKLNQWGLDEDSE